MVLEDCVKESLDPKGVMAHRLRTIALKGQLKPEAAEDRQL